MFYAYGEKEIQYLSAKDPKLGEAIRKIGRIDRLVDSDLFSSVVHHILGQQISSAAQATIWKRLTDAVGAVNAENLLRFGREQLQGIGLTFRKADYILNFCEKIHGGALNLEDLYALPDAEVIAELTKLKGVGVWTAEMILIFCMQRPDVVSFGDLAILRGMRMLYRHRNLSRTLFDRYRRRYTPYGTVASLYLWAIAGGAIPEWTDPGKTKKSEGKR
jgi:DNA-3-methyladenine glycosylase II